MPGMIEVTEDDFAGEVATPGILTVVEFWAPWCGPCRAMVPLLEQVAVERAGVVRVVTVNADEHPRLGMRYGVRGIPTLLFFRDGAVVDRITGAAPRSRIDQVIARHTA